MKSKTFFGLLIVLAGYIATSNAAVTTNWVADSGFEALSVWSHPDAATTPWFSFGESGDGQVAREESIANSGSQSLRYTVYGEPAATQNLGLTVDSNVNYEISFSMRLDEFSSNPAHTNDTNIDFILYTSPTEGGSYGWKKSIIGITPSTTNAWETIKLVIAGSDPLLADHHGEYFQFRLKKGIKNSEYAIYLDDVSFGEYVADPAPTNLLVGFDTSTGANPDHSAAGITGSIFLNLAAEGGLDTSYGSTDGSFGNTNGASLLLSGYKVHKGNNLGSNDTVSIQIQNNSGVAVQLDSIHFDYSRTLVGSPKDVTLYYGWGDLVGTTNDTILFSAIDVATGEKAGNYLDYDISLAGLPDQILANGQKATFKLQATNADELWNKGAFDNIAIFGGSPSGSAFEIWVNTYDLIGSPDADPDYDYDGDGLANLYEYGLGGDPTNPTLLGHTPTYGSSSSDGTNWFEYIYPRRITPGNNLIYHLEQSADLVLFGFTNSGNYIEGNVGTIDADFESVTNRIPTTGKTTEFIQLIVTQ